MVCRTTNTIYGFVTDFPVTFCNLNFGKMTALQQKLTTLATSAYRATVNVKDLTNSEGYEISDIRIVQTRYGPSVVVTAQLELEPVDVYLPKRFSTSLTKADCDEILRDKGYRIRASGETVNKSPVVFIFKP